MATERMGGGANYPRGLITSIASKSGDLIK